MGIIAFFLVWGASGAWAESLPSPGRWQWTIDGASYSVTLTKTDLSFFSETKNLNFKVRPCLQPAMTGLLNDLESRIRKDEEPKKFPEGSDPILLLAPHRKPIKVARGNDLGLFLLTFKSRILALTVQERRMCR